MMVRTLITLATVLALAHPSAGLADSTTTCRVDSGGHRICVERSREKVCTETCRVDSGGHRICRTVCR